MTDILSDISARSADLQAALAADRRGFPFAVELSLAPLVRFWTESFAEDRSAKGMVAAIIRHELEKAPELLEALDAATVTKHRKLVDVLMAAVFPPALREQEYGAALVPFQLTPFYATPPVERLLARDGRLQGRINLDEATLADIRRFFAYALVLHRVHGIALEVDYTLIFTVPDPETSLDRHFKVAFDWRFLDVIPLGAVPPLPGRVRERLEAGLVDPDVLREILPAGRFVIRGFTIFKAVDVTDQTVLSSLQRDLIDKESIVTAARFHGLQDKLRTLFRRPQLRVGLAAIDGDRVLVLDHRARLDHGCIFADSAHHRLEDFAGSVYERAIRDGAPLIIEDVGALPAPTCIEDQLVASGVRNLLVAPLVYQERLIGTLELGSPQPGDLNATHLPKLHDVLPLFSMTVQRSLAELNARVQAVIKEKCTAIHPAVEWRFRRAVLDAIERHGARGAGEPVELEPIVFPDVYPLYALTDVRGSSTLRARAIQADLLAQLTLARAVARSAHAARPMPALDELGYRIDKHAAQVETSLKSGDEVAVIAFLRGEVEARFAYLAALGADVAAAIETYRAALDPRLGTVYAERRRFEESVTQLAEAVSAYLELEQLAAQAMVPHFFEKQKTDGVDYQIYAGASLCEEGRCDALALRNLRLWQLMVTCGIARRAERLRDRLPIPLETAHLVLVQHAPLAIRFRFDEKRFDVDGAYDIRYEIVKKRIDKALVRGTGERATQPGRIAIVYTQPDEADEYRGYIEYLQHLGYLAPAVEDLELEELQGVRGLRALRVTVDVDDPRVERPGSVAARLAPAGLIP
jgi:hypothetical protein